MGSDSLFLKPLSSTVETGCKHSMPDAPEYCTERYLYLTPCLRARGWSVVLCRNSSQEYSDRWQNHRGQKLNEAERAAVVATERLTEETERQRGATKALAQEHDRALALVQRHNTALTEQLSAATEKAEQEVE